LVEASLVGVLRRPAAALRAALARVGARLRAAGGTLLSREIGVLTNAIAFNFLLCLFPLLLVVAAFSQQLPGGRRVGVALLLVLQELIPFEHDSVAASVAGLARIARGLEFVSLLLIVWGSSGIFIPVEMALNRAWGGTPHRNFWRSRLRAFLMTLAGGLLVLVSVGLTVAARGASREWPTLAALGTKASALVLTYFLFFLIYRFVPAAPVETRIALKAALWAGTVWEAMKYGFVGYLPRLNLRAFYGPLAFSVSLILWAYVSSLVLVAGALMVPVKPREKPA
jgi:membrane protein/epoxyqueuosine reductase